MKNSPISALVMFGIAALVGGVAWMAAGQESVEPDVAPMIPPTVKTPKVMSVTPKEAKMARIMEENLEKIEEYKRNGRVLDNGAIKTVDESGTPLYVHPELIEGVGRFGEPLWMMATYKKKNAVPLLRNRKAPKADKVATMRRLPKGQTALTLGKKGRPTKGLDAPNDGEQGGGQNSGNQDAPGKPGEKPESPSAPSGG